jgi:hypothetical protein
VCQCSTALPAGLRPTQAPPEKGQIISKTMIWAFARVSLMVARGCPRTDRRVSRDRSRAFWMRRRQPVGAVSDRDCSMFKEPISIGRGACLYLRRWISPTSSGRRFAAASPSRSSRGRRSEVGDRGEIRGTCSTGSSGSCGRERRGRTFRGATHRRRRATIASRSGSARVCSTECLPRWPRTFGGAARWT